MPAICRVLSLGFLLLAAGCKSPFYADRGALVGGLAGLGVGTAVGDANGDPAAGAILGTAIGAMTGAAVGEHMDAEVARSRAEIEARLGKQLAGAVTIDDVAAMTQAGLSESVISTHIRANGMAQPLGVNDLIALRNQGIADSVIQTMQQTPVPQLATPPAYGPAPPGPVVVQQVYPPWCAPPPPPAFYYRHWGRRHGHGVGWGFSMWP